MDLELEYFIVIIGSLVVIVLFSLFFGVSEASDNFTRTVNDAQTVEN